MTSKRFASTLLVGAGLLALSLRAGADTIQPASLLVFPNFDNTRFELTLLTVTNTNDDPVNGSINVEFVYINGANCQEFNRTRTLTANDEISVVTKFDNPNMVKGYCYVFAKNKTTGHATSFNYLIGTELVFIAGSVDQHPIGVGIYEVEPWSFKAIPPTGSDTDLPHGNNPPNGLRDLDGIEYQAAPDKLLFPRFLGQNGPFSVSEDLVLINLTGGALFNATVDFLVFNDNEEAFSAQYEFTCWTRVHLDDISLVFDNAFLLTTNQDPNEIPGTTPTTANETGWFWINGDNASSTAAQFQDPAILASFIEGITFVPPPPGSTPPPTAFSIGGAYLPYTLGTQTNGSLLSHNLFGN
jgi:hypothetical protein